MALNWDKSDDFVLKIRQCKNGCFLVLGHHRTLPYTINSGFLREEGDVDKWINAVRAAEFVEE